MRKLLILTVLWLAALGPLRAGRSDDRVEMIVHASPSDIAGIAERYGMAMVGTIDEGHGVFLLRSSGGGRYDASKYRQMEQDPEVIGCELNVSVDLPETQTGRLNQSTAAILETLPDRTIVPYFDRLVWRGYAEQPAAAIINVGAAQRRYGVGRAVVAIIDTGIDDQHPALAGAIAQGFDFVADRPGIPSDLDGLSQSTAAILEGSGGGLSFRQAKVNQSTAAILEQSTAAILERRGLPDGFGHGTMVAGLVRLVAPEASLMPLRVFTADGTATTADIIHAIYWAVDHGANVINMSFSLTAPSDELLHALNYANERNVLAVASAGNAGMETTTYPAAFRHVIGVASTNNDDGRSAFSNYGNGLVRIAAPGEGLITPFPGGAYAAVWGTSFSAALVSGAGALIIEEYGVDPERAAQQLARARRVGQKLGVGRLDVYDALRKTSVVNR